MTTNKVQLIEGQTYHVFETKGMKMLSVGLSSSERLAGDETDIQPSENLILKKKLTANYGIAVRENGIEFRLVAHHCDANAPYYATRKLGDKAPAKTKEQLIAEKQALLAKLQAELEEAEMEQAIEQEAADKKMEEAILAAANG